MRYLAAYGPSTPADLQTWSGLAGTREILESLRTGLRTFRDERGRELFDVPGKRLPDPDTPAPVRFLLECDNVLLAHADRTRVLPEGTPQWTAVGWGSVFIDGYVTARWKLERSKDAAKLRIEPFGKLPRADRSTLLEEGEGLLAFLAADATPQVVVIDPASGPRRRVSS